MADMEFAKFFNGSVINDTIYDNCKTAICQKIYKSDQENDIIEYKIENDVCRGIFKTHLKAGKYLMKATRAGDAGDIVCVVYKYKEDGTIEKLNFLRMSTAMEDGETECSYVIYLSSDARFGIEINFMQRSQGFSGDLPQSVDLYEVKQYFFDGIVLGTGCNLGELARHSICMGKESIVNSKYSGGIGRSLEINADYSFGGGRDNIIDGPCAVVFGAGNHVGENGASFGVNNKGNVKGAIMIGNGIEITAQYSIGMGIGLKSAYSNQTVLGKYNKNKAGTVLEVGNGTSIKEDNRSNALEVYADGHLEAGRSTSEKDSGQVLVTKDYIKTENIIYNPEIIVKDVRDGRASLSVNKYETLGPDDPYASFGNMYGGRYTIRYRNSGGTYADQYLKIYNGNTLLYHFGYGAGEQLTRDDTFTVDIPYNLGNITVVTNAVASYEITPISNTSAKKIADIDLELARLNTGKADVDSFVYEFERDIPYIAQGDAEYQQLPTVVALERMQDGKILDIVSIILSGYVNLNDGRACYFNQDITRQVQGVPEGENGSFKITGILADNGSDDLSMYAFKLDVKCEGETFKMKAERVVVGEAFKGAQRTTAANLSNVKVRSILARKIKVV